MKRFSLRDLVWLSALCAILFGWWIDHNRNRRPHYFTFTATGDVRLHNDDREETLVVEGLKSPWGTPSQ